MATAFIQYESRLTAPRQQDIVPMRFPRIRRTILITLIFGILTFVAALYYVEQQVTLQNLNYEIIALKQQKRELAEDQKTLQLQLDQMKRLDAIEQDMANKGFVPVEDHQIRIVPPAQGSSEE